MSQVDFTKDIWKRFADILETFLNSLNNGTFLIILLGIVLLMDTVFYNWDQTNSFYLGVLYLLAFTTFATQYWRTKKRLSKIIAFLSFLAFFSLDLLFYVLIVLNEGITDYLGLSLSILDGIGIVFLVYWSIKNLN